MICDRCGAALRKNGLNSSGEQRWRGHNPGCQKMGRPKKDTTLSQLERDRRYKKRSQREIVYALFDPGKVPADHAGIIYSAAFCGWITTYSQKAAIAQTGLVAVPKSQLKKSFLRMIGGLSG